MKNSYSEEAYQDGVVKLNGQIHTPAPSFPGKTHFGPQTVLDIMEKSKTPTC
jgi:hypothetical protein